MSFKRLKQQIENHISWFTFTGKMKFSDIINKFEEREAVRKQWSLFLQKVTPLHYLVGQSICNPFRQVSDTQDWHGFWKIQLSLFSIFFFHSTFKTTEMLKKSRHEPQPVFFCYSLRPTVGPQRGAHSAIPPTLRQLNNSSQERAQKQGVYKGCILLAVCDSERKHYCMSAVLHSTSFKNPVQRP